MTDRTLLNIDAGVAEVQLNCPEKMNAIDPAIFETLVTVGKRSMNEVDLRVAVLSGKRRAFCVSLDTGSMASLGSNDVGSDINVNCLTKRTHGAADLPQHTCTIWRDLPVPVLAVVHGVAYGNGLQIALGANVCYVAADTRLSIVEIKRGLVPDTGGMAPTRGLVRPNRLHELIYSGHIVDGEEAFVLGLAACVVDDPRAAALVAARDIALKGPDAIRADKCLMQVAEDGDTAAILLAKSVEQDWLIGTDNQREVVLAGMQNRAPVFQPAAESEQRLGIAWG